MRMINCVIVIYHKFNKKIIYDIVEFTHRDFAHCIIYQISYYN